MTITEADHEGPAVHHVDVTLDCLDTISFALAHNRLPAVHRVTIRNAGGELRGAVLSVTVSDDTGALSVPFEQVVDVPPGRRSCSTISVSGSTGRPCTG